MDMMRELYERGQRGELVEIFLNDKLKKSHSLLLYAGLSMVELGFAEAAERCLLKVLDSVDEELLGKVNRYIGLSKYILGSYEDADIYFSCGVTCGDGESRLWKSLLFPSCSDVVVTENIIFRFVDNTNALHKKIFILKNVKAYQYILTIIGKLCIDKKTDIYVYENRFDSIGNPLSYCDNGLKVIHTNIGDVNGHELAHIMFNSLHANMIRNVFIDEGIATFFDVEMSFYEYIRHHEICKEKYDVIELWNNFPRDTPAQIRERYYFAGAFVGYLFQTYGRDDFLLFIKDESYNNAIAVFGPSLTDTIKKFYTELN